MALENIVGVTSVQRRWMVAFGFGLVHGFGFSFALRETLQFAGAHLLTSLLSFNVGVELGQLAGAGGARARRCSSLFRYVVAGAHGDDHPVGAGRAHGLALDAERWERLRQFAWPALGPAAGRGGAPLADGRRSCVAGVAWAVAAALPPPEETLR